MAVTRTSTGSLVSSAAALTATFGAGATAGDLGILIVESANQTVATPSGWTKIDGFGVGSAGLAGGTALWAFSKVSITSGDISSGISVADSGDHQNAVLLTFTGYDATTPWVKTFFGTDSSTSATTVNINGATGTTTTITANDVALGIICTDRDSATVSTNGSAAWANIAGSNAFIVNVSSATGAGGGIIVNQLTPSGTQTADASFSCTITASANASLVVVIKAAAAGTTVAPSVGHLTFGGKIPTVTKLFNISPSGGHLTFGGKVPSVTVGASLNPTAGHLAFTGYQPAITRTTAVAPSVGHLTFGGKVPSVTRTTAISPAAGHLTFGGKVPSVTLTTNVSPSSGHLTFGGKVPALTFTTGVSPATGHLSFGGKVPLVTRTVNLTPSSGHFTFGGKTPSLTIGINPAPGHLVFTGYVPDVSGTVAPSTSNPLKVTYRHRGRNC